jgi:hypothetical protein
MGVESAEDQRDKDRGDTRRRTEWDSHSLVLQYPEPNEVLIPGEQSYRSGPVRVDYEALMDLPA